MASHADRVRRSLGADGDHEALDALLAEVEQLRAALRSEVAKRHHNMDGSALTEDQIDGLVAEALRAVRG